MAHEHWRDNLPDFCLVAIIRSDGKSYATGGGKHYTTQEARDYANLLKRWKARGVYASDVNCVVRVYLKHP